MRMIKSLHTFGSIALLEVLTGFVPDDLSTLIGLFRIEAGDAFVLAQRNCGECTCWQRSPVAGVSMLCSVR